MAIRNILREDDPFLAKKSRDIDTFNRRLHTLLDDMRQTMLDAGGIGLAAPQVGVLRRAILIADLSDEDEENENNDEDYEVIELVNPEIIEIEGTQTANEGCLSIPGKCGVVTRPFAVKVKAQDRYGNIFDMIFEDVMARAICHEVDHLNGILYTAVAERMLTKEEMDELDREEEERKTGKRSKRKN